MAENVADAIIAKLRQRRDNAEKKHNDAQRKLAVMQAEAQAVAEAYYESCDALSAAEHIARQTGGADA